MGDGILLLAREMGCSPEELLSNRIFGKLSSKKTLIKPYLLVVISFYIKMGVPYRIPRIPPQMYREIMDELVQNYGL